MRLAGVKGKGETMTAIKTINRGWLLRQAKAGKLAMVGSYHFDDQFGQSGSKDQLMPVQIIKNHSEHKSGVLGLYESDFRSKSGCAYQSAEGDAITLIVHSNCNYDLRLVA